MRAEVFGVPLDLLNMDETICRCVELVESRRPVQHVVINAGKVVMMEESPDLRDVVASCDLVNADGQSIVWAGRLLGLPVPERVAGIDLMHRLLEEAQKRQWPVYFLGARRDVLDSCLETLRGLYPGLHIAGFRDGYFSDDASVAAAIRQSGARLLFVGISSPRKERFLSEHLPAMGPVFAMGVGGSFDVVAGLTKRAPVWMQRAGLEWLFRFSQEPRRMWKRYLLGNSRFAVIVAREWLMKRTADAVAERD